MSDALLGALLENTALAAGIAALAVVASWLTHRVAVAHALYVVALARMVAPALFDLPVLGGSDPAPASDLAVLAHLASATPVGVVAPAQDPVTAAVDPSVVLAGVWLLGAAWVGAVAVRRRRRFAALVARADHASAELQGLLAVLGRRLGLARPPELRVVDARIPPMVFHLGGRGCVLLPRMAVRVLEPAEIRAVLAHELAHLAGRDHWTRALEAVVAVVHWWNPVAWWIRRRLRDAEEVRCDARAIAALDTGPRPYGRAILKTISHLEGDLSGLPLAVSALGGPATLKKRLTMIADTKTDHRLSPLCRAALAFGAAALLPLGLCAQDPEAKGESRAEKLERIRVLLRELKQELGDQGGARVVERTEVAEEVREAPRAESRAEAGKAGTVERSAIRLESGEAPSGGLFVIRSKDGEPARILRSSKVEVRGDHGGDHHGGDASTGTGPFEVEVRVGDDGEPKVRVDGVEVEGARPGVFVLRGAPGAAKHGGFVWKAGVGDDGEVEVDVDVEIEGLEDLPGRLRALHGGKVVELRHLGGAHGEHGEHGEHAEHGDEGHDVVRRAVVVRPGSEDLEDLPENVRAIVLRHLGELGGAGAGADDDVRVRSRVMRLDDVTRQAAPERRAGDEAGTEQLRDQLRQLERQLRALEKRLEQLDGKKV